MKEKVWKLNQKHKKHKKFEKFRYLKKIDDEEIPLPPENFKEVYKDLAEPTVKKGNNYSKPNRFVRELKMKQEKDQYLLEKAQAIERKNKDILKKEVKKKKFARLLAKKNSKGQPKLSNTLMHLCDKLGIKK